MINEPQIWPESVYLLEMKVWNEKYFIEKMSHDVISELHNDGTKTHRSSFKSPVLTDEMWKVCWEFSVLDGKVLYHDMYGVDKFDVLSQPWVIESVKKYYDDFYSTKGRLVNILSTVHVSGSKSDSSKNKLENVISIEAPKESSVYLLKIKVEDGTYFVEKMPHTISSTLTDTNEKVYYDVFEPPVLTDDMWIVYWEFDVADGKVSYRDMYKIDEFDVMAYPEVAKEVKKYYDEFHSVAV
jgi:hypothetical protein